MTLLISGALSGAKAIHANGDRVGFSPRHVRWEVVGGFSSGLPVGTPVWFAPAHGLMAPAHANGYKTVCILLEPPQLHPEDYQHANDLLWMDALDVLYTSHPDAFMPDQRVRAYPHGGTRIHPSDWRIWDKVGNISMVLSDKRSLPGHQLRHEVAEWFGSVVSVKPISSDQPRVAGFDIYGPSYRPIKHKVDALAPYRFSVAIENVNTGLWFTEALLDCFLTGTIPIYWGSRDALKHWGFDMLGIIHCTNLAALKQAVTTLATPGYYEARLGAVERNFIKAHEYTCTEDWLWRHDPRLFSTT